MVDMPPRYSPTHLACQDMLTALEAYTLMATRLGLTTEGMQVATLPETNGWMWWYWRMPDTLWQAQQPQPQPKE